MLPPMRASVRVFVVAVGFASLSLTGYARFAPLDAPESRGTVPGTVVLDAHGIVLERDMGAGLRIPTTIDRVAPRMLQATISAEDRRFIHHVGVDPVAVARALANSSAPSGASTITQQLARRLYLADDSSPLALRKTHEALIALQLEANRSKGEILQLYLNDVYYGRGAYGVEAAARVYFGIGAAKTAGSPKSRPTPPRPNASSYFRRQSRRSRTSSSRSRAPSSGVCARTSRVATAWLSRPRSTRASSPRRSVWCGCASRRCAIAMRRTRRSSRSSRGRAASSRGWGARPTATPRTAAISTWRERRVSPAPR
jgi:hypothetical protein